MIDLKKTVINYQSKLLDEEPEHNPHKHLIKKKTSKIELKRSSKKLKNASRLDYKSSYATFTAPADPLLKSVLRSYFNASS